MTKRHKRGFGSPRKLASGRYQVRYTHPDTGRRITAGKTFPNKAAAEREIARIQGEIDAGTLSPNTGAKGQAAEIDGRGLTLRELGEHWRPLRLTKRGQPLSPNTINGYRTMIENALRDIADMPIQAITPTVVEKWFSSPASRQAPNYATKVYSHLGTLMNYAVKRKWIAENPCDIPGASNYVPEQPVAVPSAEQIEILLNEAQGSMRAIVALAAWGGLRKGEILELRRQDVTIEQIGSKDVVWISISRGVIWVAGEPVVRPPKTPGSVRTVGLPDRVTEILISHLATVPINPDALLFPGEPGTQIHYKRLQLDRAWQKLRQVAGFTGRFHSLRSFAATEYGKTGATAVELMDRFGHRNIKTAMRYQRTTGREVELLERLG